MPPFFGPQGVSFTNTAGDVILTDPVGAGVTVPDTAVPIVFPYQNTATYFYVECTGSKVLEAGVIPTMTITDGTGIISTLYPVNANTDVGMFLYGPCAAWLYSLDNFAAGVVTTIQLTIWAYA